MAAQIGADGLYLLGDPRPELLFEVARIQPQPGGEWVNLEKCLGFHSTRRLRIIDSAGDGQGAGRPRPAPLPAAWPGTRGNEGSDERGGHGRLPAGRGRDSPVADRQRVRVMSVLREISRVWVSEGGLEPP